MAFIDEITLYAKAGDGGNGVVRWQHEYGKEFSGPAGGDGGNGGDVYARATRDIYILAKYRHQKEFFAVRGQDGMSDNMKGAKGEDLVIDVPVGSIVRNLRTHAVIELTQEGQTELLLSGGRGGFGNDHFKSSTNVTPQESTPGKPGDDSEFQIELQLFADIGLVGLPNAGKSSLLNALTRSQAKVGAYQFTTLDPNLGDFYGHIIADIPGLIEGASEGKGLGVKFLRHIKRTKMIAHLVSCENENMLATYEMIRHELAHYDASLSEKEEIIILSKTDMIDAVALENALGIFEKLGKPVFALSLYDDASVKTLADGLSRMLEAKK